MVLFPAGARDFMFSKVSRMARGLGRVYLVGTGVGSFLLGVKRPVRDVGHSPASTAKVKHTPSCRQWGQFYFSFLEQYL